MIRHVIVPSIIDLHRVYKIGIECIKFEQVYRGKVVLYNWIVGQSIVLDILSQGFNRIAPLRPNQIILRRSIRKIVSARKCHSGIRSIDWLPLRPDAGVVFSRIECCPHSMCRASGTSDYAYLASSHVRIAARRFYQRLDVILLVRSKSRDVIGIVSVILTDLPGDQAGGSQSIGDD